eukprot:9413283-Pyramimonas_sp.AAC.1
MGWRGCVDVREASRVGNPRRTLGQTYGHAGEEEACTWKETAGHQGDNSSWLLYYAVQKSAMLCYATRYACYARLSMIISIFNAMRYHAMRCDAALCDAMRCYAE